MLHACWCTSILQSSMVIKQFVFLIMLQNLLDCVFWLMPCHFPQSTCSLHHLPAKKIEFFFCFFSYVKLTLEPRYTRVSIKDRYWLSNTTYRTPICCLLRFQGQLGCACYSCFFHQLQRVLEKFIEIPALPLPLNFYTSCMFSDSSLENCMHTPEVQMCQ